MNRLITVSVSGSGGWGQAFTHNGFGNLWTQAVTKGTALTVSVSLNMANNRINGWTYDANGNTTATVGATMTYDVSNRMTSLTKTLATEEHGYLPDNKRVWKKESSGTEHFYVYGIFGERVVTYKVEAGTTFTLLDYPDFSVHFAGKKIRSDGSSVVEDRLGSVMARTPIFSLTSPNLQQHDYFPYGDEIGTATAGNRDKFGTYLRDQFSGLDYADQRYFSGLQGRFLTADP